MRRVLVLLLLFATTMSAELRLGPEIAIGEVSRDVKDAQNSRPAIVTNGKETLVIWAAQVLNKPGVLVAARLGTSEIFRLADDVWSYDNDVAAFHIDGAYVVLFKAGRDELRALRFTSADDVETLSIARSVRKFVAASNGRDILLAYDAGNGPVGALLQGDLSNVRELEKFYGDHVAVASDGVGYGILTAQGSTLYVCFFDGKNLTNAQELLRSGGEFPAIALAASGGTFTAAWTQCVEETCAVRGGRFTRDQFLGALQFDAPRTRKKSRELGLTILGPDALLVTWGESDEYERLQRVVARRITGTDTIDPEPFTLSSHAVATLVTNGKLVIADAVVRAGVIDTPMTGANAKLDVVSWGTTFDSVEVMTAAGNRLGLVRRQHLQLAPYVSYAANVVERGRVRELPLRAEFYIGVCIASDGRNIAIAGFDGARNLWFQPENKKPRMVLAKQNWTETTAMAWAGDRYLIAFTRDNRLHVVEIDRDGKLLREPREVAPLLTKAEEPIQRAPAFAVGNGEVLLVWAESNAFYEGEQLLRAVRLGRSEKHAEPMLLTRNGAMPAAAWNGRVFAVLWTHIGDEPAWRGAILRGSNFTPIELEFPHAQDSDVVAIGETFYAAARDWDDAAKTSLSRVVAFDEEGITHGSVATPAGGEHFMHPLLAATRDGKLALFHTRYVDDEPYGGTYRTFLRFVER